MLYSVGQIPVPSLERQKIQQKKRADEANNVTGHGVPASLNSRFLSLCFLAASLSCHESGPCLALVDSHTHHSVSSKWWTSVSLDPRPQ